MRLYQLSGKKIKADEERVLFVMFYSSVIRLNLEVCCFVDVQRATQP